MKSPQQLASTRDDDFLGKEVQTPYCQEKAGTLYTYLKGVKFDSEMSRHVAESLRRIGRLLLDNRPSK